MSSDRNGPRPRLAFVLIYQHTIEVRARYAECDPMGYVHHSVYSIWFELARTELLRETVESYAEMERRGLLIVVVKLDIRFHRPARYDDLVEVTATLKRSAGVRIEHTYEARRDGRRLASAATTLACVDRAGKLRPVPDFLACDPERPFSEGTPGRRP